VDYYFTVALDKVSQKRKSSVNQLIHIFALFSWVGLDLEIIEFLG